MYFQRLITKVKENPLEQFLGLWVVLIIMFGASVKDVASTALAIFSIYGLINIHKVRNGWQELQTNEKILMVLFLLYVSSGFVAYLNVTDTREYLKEMDRYVRFLFITPIVIALLKSGVDLKKYFYIGMVLSGPAYFYFAIDSVIQTPNWPAGKDYHHITFGDAAMLNALMLLMMLVLEPWRLRWKAVVMVSIFLAIYASILSQARGAWVVVPVGLLLLTMAIVRRTKIKLLHLVFVLIVAITAILVSPASDVIKMRYIEALNDVELFIDNKDASTSIGGRFALWDIALETWRLSPFIGTGPGDFDDDVKKYQKNEAYSDLVVHGSVHNIYLQSLVSTGLIGLVSMVFAIVILPALYFYSRIRRAEKFGYYGLMLISSYAIFGLSESWTLRAPVVSIFIVYFCVCFLSCREKSTGI